MIRRARFLRGGESAGGVDCLRFVYAGRTISTSHLTSWTGEDARDSSDCMGELGRDVGGDESGDMATGAGETERSRAGSSSCRTSRPTGEGSGSIVGEGGIDDRRESGEDI